MWVVKLGGSLGENETLRHWLKIIARFGQGRVVIVPGGGRFADQVREAQKRWRFSENIAHAMAVLAMHQFGWLLQGLEPGLQLAQGIESVRRILGQQQACIWLPALGELERAGIPASWEVTSDSLSAWLAGRLEAARLCLVKSAPQVRRINITDLVASGVIDSHFLRFASSSVPMECWHWSQHDAFARRLQAYRDVGQKPG